MSKSFRGYFLFPAQTDDLCIIQVSGCIMEGGGIRIKCLAFIGTSRKYYTAKRF